MSGGHADIKQAMVALYPRISRFAHGLCGSAQEAEDLVQAAYTRALERLDQTGTRLDSWLYRITQNIYFNKLSAEKVRGKHQAELEWSQPTSSDGARAIESFMTLKQARTFIGELPAEFRVVLLLVCVEGLSYKETAEALGVPIGTVTSRLARARTALANRMATVET